MVGIRFLPVEEESVESQGEAVARRDIDFGFGYGFYKKQ